MITFQKLRFNKNRIDFIDVPILEAMDWIKKSIDEGSDVNTVDEFDNSALHHAARKGIHKYYHGSK